MWWRRWVGSELAGPPRTPPPPPTGQGRLRSPKMGQSAEGGKGKDKRIIVVVRSPCQENDPADAHTGAHKSVLESANPAWTRSVYLDAPGQRHGQQPVSGTADPGLVKQDKSSRGNQNTFGPTEGQNVQGREYRRRKGKQTNTMALCRPPPPRSH